jgi:hypothetical protein
VSPSQSSRLLSRSLAGYLCGTHSGALARRRGDRLEVDALAGAHIELSAIAAETTITLGTERWQPSRAARTLERELRSCLAHPAVIELVLFGSQARGGTTAFSDVDAVLVIEDAAAEQPGMLRKLRRRVLQAQRAVVSHQPMQHHGFELATPKLLREANNALAMPAVAFAESRSLMGNPVDATFTPDQPHESRGRLFELVRNTAVSAWPRHPWRLHGLVSMFELLPTLYLQARGQAVPKWRSFEEARPGFGDRWWPYDVLRQVRDEWPPMSPAALRAGAAVGRNPWLAVAAWSRLPMRGPSEVRRLLSDDCLAALRELAREMGEDEL